ncbi:MAG: EamA family transporter [Actinobacteria bacterium HGW-Actinobacteria-8]|nr:MAG: EamA family transporter [Actinobacteria bacterium HGW-Actinobacteria-8]
MLSNRPALIAATALGPIAWGTTYANTTEFLPANAPMLTALLRALPAGLILLAITRTLPRGSWWWKASLLGVLNVGAFFPLLFIGAYRLPGGVAATVGAIQPLIVIALAHGLLGERATGIKIGAGLAGVVGVALLVLTPAAKLDALGLIASLVGAALMAAGVTLTKAWALAIPPLTLTGWQLTAGGIFLLPIAAIEGLPDAPFTMTNVAGYVWLGVVGTVVAYSLWFRGIGRLPASVVTFLSLLAAVTAAIIGWVFLGESLSPLQVVGAALALGAVATVALTSAPRKANDADQAESLEPATATARL